VGDAHYHNGEQQASWKAPLPQSPTFAYNGFVVLSQGAAIMTWRYDFVLITSAQTEKVCPSMPLRPFDNS
jgi:hypothetical protein